MSEAQPAEPLQTLRHTAAHVLAQAVVRLFPQVRLGIGPAIQDGFYYDFDLPQPLVPEDLEKIEAEMSRIVAADYPLERREVEREEAERIFQGQDYKLELIANLPQAAPITVYRQGEFTDLCAGPHLERTGAIGAFRLLSLAGAYWRGDEKRPMLQRIYGTAFTGRDELETFLWRQEEAKRRDHRKLGAELDLFSFREEAPGFCFWHPKGVVLYDLLQGMSRRLQAAHGYREVRTPPIMGLDLWKRSGHWDHYRDNMYTFEKDEEQFAVKPMNCPGHCLLFKERVRSYRELPLRYAEYGQLARFERSGTLHGLFRVRGFVQDDAHIYVTEDQIQSEISDILAIIEDLYGTFGMDYEIKLSTRPEDFMGEPALWDKAEAALGAALEAAGKPFKLNPGDGAFYGPKLDFEVTDSLGRKWQCATVQLDWQLPEKFELIYTAPGGGLERPVMIHRAVMGSVERFIGILTEHYGGAFPLWLAPVQVKVVTVADRHLPYALEVEGELAEAGYRVEVDARDEKMGAKIRDAQLEKVPYVLVVGDREAAEGTVAVRRREQGNLGPRSREEFRADLERESKTG